MNDNSLLHSGYPEIPEEQIRSLQNILIRQAKLYTMGDSSSLPIELMEELLLGIRFTIDLGRSELKSPSADIGSIYKSGQKIVARLLESAKGMLFRLSHFHPPITNRSYRDTFSELEKFPRQYDMRFFPHQIPISIDYQLSLPVSESLQGISFFCEYLRRLSLENALCRCFSFGKLKRLLTAYSSDYDDLLVNLFDPIFQNTLALSLLKKEVRGLNISGSDRAALAALFSERISTDRKNKLHRAVTRLLIELGIDSPALESYYAEIASEMLPRISSSVDTSFQGVFYTFSD